MPCHTTPPGSGSENEARAKAQHQGRNDAYDENRLRAEAAERRAAYQARLERDQRLIVAIAGLFAVIGTAAIIVIAGAFGG
jgi:type IV secretory pathway component VirB8